VGRDDAGFAIAEEVEQAEARVTHVDVPGVYPCVCVCVFVCVRVCVVCESESVHTCMYLGAFSHMHARVWTAAG
jgi:hypothetical protein